MVAKKDKTSKKDKEKKDKQKKEEDEQRKLGLSYVNKAFYDLTIADANRKIDRLQKLSEKFEEENQELVQQIEKTNDEKNDVIIYLKRMLYEKTTEIQDLREGISKLQNTKKEEACEFELKSKQLEDTYNDTKEKLTSQIKSYEGYLHSLEEFRNQREQLTAKYDKREEEIEEREKSHTKAIHDIERKFLMEKNELKRDMECQLLDLSTEFQEQTETKIASTTQRVIRENIAVNNELNDIVSIHKKLYKENSDMKKTGKELTHESQTLHQSSKKHLYQARIKKQIAEKLKHQNSILRNELQAYDTIEKESHDSRLKLEKAKHRIELLKNKIRQLEQNLHGTRCDVSCLQTKRNDYKRKVDGLDCIVLEAVGTIRDSLETQERYKRDKTGIKRENLLNQLLTVFTTYENVKEIASLPSVLSATDVYERGDLGFSIPEEPSVRPRLEGTRDILAQTGSSLEIIDYFADIDRLKKEQEQEVAVVSRPEVAQSTESESEMFDVFFDDNESSGQSDKEVGEFDLGTTSSLLRKRKSYYQ